MDVSILNLKDIELFHLAYTVSKDVFLSSPLEASPGTQKRIRKWVNQVYIADNSLPQTVKDFIDDSKSDGEFIAFMAACADYMEVHIAEKKQLFEEVTAGFTADVKNAFLHLFATKVYADDFELGENKLTFSLDSCGSYSRKLILHTSQDDMLKKVYLFDFSDAQILKDADGYQLICATDKADEGDSVPTSIHFDGATTEINLYRADRRSFCDAPWETLTCIASEILDKEILGSEYFNEKEQALIPLLQELRALSLWAPITEETPSFEILKQYIRKHNLPHLIPLLEKYAIKKKGHSVRPLLFSKLSNKFNAAACEALWRELYALVAETQEGYIDATHSYSRRKFGKIKKQIEEAFHALGYEGSYPTFRKQGAIKGIRLEESYGQSYFVGPEKNVEYIVLCREHWHFETFRIQFLCGTALLKKDESITDIYSCCFNKKGRRLFKNFYWEDGDISTLAQFAAIAAKKAECTKLAKEDKKLLGSDGVSWQYFLFEFLFAGGLFGIMMTTATFLILCLVTILTVGFGSLLEMIKTMPWLLFFAISFFGFGIPMAIVDAKAKTK